MRDLSRRNRKWEICQEEIPLPFVYPMHIQRNTIKSVLQYVHLTSVVQPHELQSQLLKEQCVKDIQMSVHPDSTDPRDWQIDRQFEITLHEGILNVHLEGEHENTSTLHVLKRCKLQTVVILPILAIFPNPGWFSGRKRNDRSTELSFEEDNLIPFHARSPKHTSMVWQ
jgi:hypothetical protein